MNIKDSQKFIKDYNLSSHKWLIARNKLTIIGSSGFLDLTS